MSMTQILIQVRYIITQTYQGGGCHPLHKVFLSFFLENKLLAPDVFSSVKKISQMFYLAFLLHSAVHNMIKICKISDITNWD